MADYSNGLFGGVKDAMMSPLFLGGAGLLSGGGMQGLQQGFAAANQGQQYDEGRRKIGIEQQRSQQFSDMFANGNPQQFKDLPQGFVDLARVSGPDAGPAMLAKGFTGKMDLDTQGKLQAQSLALQFENAKRLSQFQQDQKFNLLDRLNSGGQPQPQPQQAAPMRVQPGMPRPASGTLYQHPDGSIRRVP